MPMATVGCGGRAAELVGIFDGEETGEEKGAVEGGIWAVERESGDGSLRRLRRHRRRWHPPEVPLALRLLVHQVPDLRHRHSPCHDSLAGARHRHHQAPPVHPPSAPLRLSLLPSLAPRRRRRHLQFVSGGLLARRRRPIPHHRLHLSGRRRRRARSQPAAPPRHHPHTQLRRILLPGAVCR